MAYDTTGGSGTQRTETTGSSGSTTGGSTSTGTGTATGTVQFPIDDPTYNLLQALTSKLESIDAYRTYMQEDASSGQIFRHLAEQDANAAKQLLQQLRQKLNSTGNQ